MGLCKAKNHNCGAPWCVQWSGGPRLVIFGMVLLPPYYESLEIWKYTLQSLRSINSALYVQTKKFYSPTIHFKVQTTKISNHPTSIMSEILIWIFSLVNYTESLYSLVVWICVSTLYYHKFTTKTYLYFDTKFCKNYLFYFHSKIYIHI